MKSREVGQSPTTKGNRSPSLERRREPEKWGTQGNSLRKSMFVDVNFDASTKTKFGKTGKGNPRVREQKGTGQG